MTDAIGYIEKDWGEAFPDAWIWLQGNVSESKKDVSFMCSIASIPFMGMKFIGLICVLDLGGKQHRFATYNGARILSVIKTGDGTEIELKKGRLRLKIKAYSDGFESLVAPTRNGMERELFESITGEIEIELSDGNDKIVNEHLIMCGIEVSEIGDLER
jgi:hypothetical protein